MMRSFSGHSVTLFYAVLTTFLFFLSDLSIRSFVFVFCLDSFESFMTPLRIVPSDFSCISRVQGVPNSRWSDVFFLNKIFSSSSFPQRGWYSVSLGKPLNQPSGSDQDTSEMMELP